MADFRKIDPLLHSRVRLSIMSVLISVEEADFNYLKEATGATDGNLSTHIYKLEEAGYVEIQKQFVDNKPNTVCQVTPKGHQAFEEYVEILDNMIHPEKNDEKWSMNKNRKEYVVRINRAIDYLENNLEQSLPLEEIAKVDCFSPYHFHRIFRSVIVEGVRWSLQFCDLS